MTRSVNFPKKEDDGLVIVTINVPRRHLNVIKQLTDARLYPSRSEAIRVAIRDWLITESKLYRYFINPIVEVEDPSTIRIPNGDGTHTKVMKIGEA